MFHLKQKELLLMIPAYNEEANIGAFLDQLAAAQVASFADILLIDDGSTDRTPEIAREKGCRVISNLGNMGYASALLLGYRYATRRNYQYLIQMDADGQHDASNAFVLYQALQENDASGRSPDLVLGERFANGHWVYPLSRLKKLAFAYFRGLIRIFCGLRIKDPTTGLQAMNQRTFAYLASLNHMDGVNADANVIIQLSLLGFRIVGVEALMHPRIAGKSMHVGLKPLAYMLRMSWAVLAVVFRVKVLGWSVDEREENDMAL